MATLWHSEATTHNWIELELLCNAVQPPTAGTLEPSHDFPQEHLQSMQHCVTARLSAHCGHGCAKDQLTT